MARNSDDGNLLPTIPKGCEVELRYSVPDKKWSCVINCWKEVSNRYYEFRTEEHYARTPRKAVLRAIKALDDAIGVPFDPEDSGWVLE